MILHPEGVPQSSMQGAGRMSRVGLGKRTILKGGLNGFAKRRFDEGVAGGARVDAVRGQPFLIDTAAIGKDGIVVHQDVVVLRGGRADPRVESVDKVRFGKLWRGKRWPVEGSSRRKRGENHLDLAFASDLGHDREILLDGGKRRACEIVQATRDDDDARAQLNDLSVEAREHVERGVAGQSAIDDLQTGELIWRLESGPLGGDGIAHEGDAWRGTRFAAWIGEVNREEHRGEREQKKQRQTAVRSDRLGDGCGRHGWRWPDQVLGASGIRRPRTPVASKSAFPTAGATVMMGVSPAPAEGMSLRSRRTASI